MVRKRYRVVSKCKGVTYSQVVDSETKANELAVEYQKCYKSVRVEIV